LEAGYAQKNGVIACQLKILNHTLKMDDGDMFDVINENHHMLLAFGRMKTHNNDTGI